MWLTRAGFVLVVILSAAMWACAELGDGPIRAVDTVDHEPTTPAKAESVDTAGLSVEEKLDLLLERLGDPPGRSSLADQVAREFLDLQRKVDLLEKELQRVQSDLRRLKTGR